MPTQHLHVDLDGRHPPDAGDGDRFERREPVTDIRGRALEALAQQTIELPSWAFGNSGTRFKVFGQPGVARNPYEKLEDAAQVHKHTGVAPRVSLHMPWDLVDDYGKLAAHAADSASRSARSTPTCSRTTTTSSGRSPTPIPPSGARRSSTTRSAWRSCARPARRT